MLSDHFKNTAGERDGWDEDLVLPLGGDGHCERVRGQLEGPLGRRLERAVVQHHGPPVAVVGAPDGGVAVEALPDNRPRHERRRHRHRRLVPRRHGRGRRRLLHVDRVVGSSPSSRAVPAGRSLRRRLPPAGALDLAPGHPGCRRQGC